MKHLINLMNNKISRTKLIYNITRDELATIRNYLASALEKK